MNTFANEYIRPKYLNVFKYHIICPIPFLTYLAILIFFFGPILNHFGPIITILKFLGNNENLNRIAIMDIEQNNIRM